MGARYVAERHEIAARFAEYELIAPPEIREVNSDARYFEPHFNAMMAAELRRFRERPPDLQPTLDVVETFLVRLFLRRYVTWCARRGRFKQMQGAVASANRVIRA